MARFIIKNKSEMVKACRLGGMPSEMELKLMDEGKIKLCNGRVSIYEVFSQKSKEGSGERARAGDFVKIDKDGYPAVVRMEEFLNNHRKVKDDIWEEIPEPILAWEKQDKVIPEMQFLIDKKKLMFDATDPKKFFVVLVNQKRITASEDAILIFFNIKYNSDGAVVDTDIEFVEKEDFESNYQYC